MALRIFDRWTVSFHGLPVANVASVLREGQLMMPGDALIDGSELPNRATRGGEARIGIYTSPSVRLCTGRRSQSQRCKCACPHVMFNG